LVVLQQGEEAVVDVAPAVQPSTSTQLREVHPARSPLFFAVALCATSAFTLTPAHWNALHQTRAISLHESRA
jgi:hypothetical protein